MRKGTFLSGESRILGRRDGKAAAGVLLCEKTHEKQPCCCLAGIQGLCKTWRACLPSRTTAVSRIDALFDEKGAGAWGDGRGEGLWVSDFGIKVEEGVEAALELGLDLFS